MKYLILMATLSTLATPAFADGDPAEGADLFKRCKACHAMIAPDGTAVQKGGKTGPNLFGVIGRPVASDPDFKYSAAILAAAAKGLIWDEEMLADYVADPSAWLKHQTGDEKAVSKMTFKLAKDGDDIAAYLASVK